MLTHQVPDTATEREPSDADRAGVAEAGRQAVGPRRGGVFDGGQSRFGPGSAPLDVDLQLLHVREVEHYASFGNAVDAVTAATNGQLLPRLASERDDVSDVGGVCRSDDDRRPAVDPAGKDRARPVVPGVVGADHPLPRYIALRACAEGCSNGTSGFQSVRRTSSNDGGVRSRVVTPGGREFRST